MSTATLASPRVTARQQWMVLILLVVSVCINYVDRGNLSVAAVDLKDALHLGPQSLGNLLAAFFWTYAGFMVVAGMLVERYNVIWVYAAGYFIWSAATALTGFANTFATLFTLRLLLGMSESVAYPSYSKIIAAGFPEKQRGIANGLIDAGSKLGPALGMVIGGMVLAEWGWRVLFISIGTISMLWLVPWCAVAPKIRTHQLTGHRDAPSFGEILSRRDAWATFLCLFCGNYGWYFMLTWIPGYLRMERHYTTEQMALIGSLPFWAVAAGAVVGGFLADAWIARGGSTTRVRKTFVATGLGVCAVLILPSAIAANQALAMALLIAASFVFGLFSSNHWAITQTLAGPAAAGKWTGLQNCAGNMAGVAAPTVTGFVVEHFHSFHYAFVSVSTMLLLGAFSYVFLVGRVQTHEWSVRPGERA
ncbi:MAG: MFS transporter [Acidobacteriaceae bacterium]|nr:MFS transporter [Acidobacteriaceae bacterium]